MSDLLTLLADIENFADIVLKFQAVTNEEQKAFYKKLGFLIKKARKEGQWKQEVLANRLGLARTSLVNIEQGTQRIQLHTILELCKLLEVDITELLPKFDVDLKDSINKKSEKQLSKQIEKQVDDFDNAKEILTKFIKFQKSSKE